MATFFMINRNKKKEKKINFSNNIKNLKSKIVNNDKNKVEKIFVEPQLSKVEKILAEPQLSKVENNVVEKLIQKKPIEKPQSTKVKQKSKNDEDLQLALALSESLEMSKNESINFIKSNIHNNIMINDDKTDISDFDYQVKNQIESFGGLCVLSNKGGGNCLFHTLSEHLNINQKQLRIDAANYINLSWYRFKNFVLHPVTLKPYKSKEEYVEYMSKDGSWGDHISLLALCELYQVNAIIIITENNKLKEPIKINVGSNVNILIKFTSEVHYEAII